MGGRYIFENETLIDIEKYDQNVDIHEMIHKILSTKTTYGFFVDLLNRICKIDTSKKWLYQILVNNMNFMQEIVATNFEYLSYLKTDNFETYLSKIEELKKNKKYYKYYMELSWMRKELNEKNYEDGWKNIAYKILTVGLLALDVNIWNIPNEAYESKQTFDRFLAEGINMKLYNPNVRFKLFIKYINPEEKSDEDLIKRIMSDCQLSRNRIQSICQKEILKIYKDYENIHYILLRTLGYGIIDMASYSFSFEEISYLNAFPANLNKAFGNCSYKLSVCERENFISEISKVKHGIVRVDNTMIGVPFCNTLAIVDYEKMTAVYSDYKDGCDLVNIIKLSSLNVVFFDIRTYPRFKEILEKAIEKDLYFVMESSILYNLEFIRTEFLNGNYSIKNYETYSLLVLKKDNKILLQLISKNAVNSIDTLWKESSISINKKEWDQLHYCIKENIEDIIENYLKYFNFALSLRNKS